MSTFKASVYKGLFESELRFFFVPNDSLTLKKTASRCNQLVIKAFVLAGENRCVGVKFSYPEFDASLYPFFIGNEDVRAIHSPTSFEKEEIENHVKAFNAISVLKYTKTLRDA